MLCVSLVDLGRFALFLLFLTKKSLLTLFETQISQKVLSLELQNKFNLIRNKLPEFIQFSLYRLLKYFFSFWFLKSNASFFGSEEVSFAFMKTFKLTITLYSLS